MAQAEGVSAKLAVTEDDEILVSTARVGRRRGRAISPALPPIVADLSETKKEDDTGNRMTN